MFYCKRRGCTTVYSMLADPLTVVGVHLAKIKAKCQKVRDGKHCVWNGIYAELLQHGYTTFCWASVLITPLTACLALSA